MIEIDDSKIQSILYDVSKKIILPKFNNLKDQDIQTKNNNDLVTKVDIEVENILNELLCKLLPESLFVGEEKVTLFPKILDHYKLNKYCWTVDPIDGTNNYVKGREKFAVMIALTFGKDILQSWIYKPLTEEIFWAKKNYGAFSNGNKILIAKKKSISNLHGSISTKYWDSKYFNKMKSIKNIFAHVNSYGCIGLEYVDIVNNIRDFSILSKLSPWDHISGILLLREAGGFDSYFDAGRYNHCFVKKNLVVANNSEIGNEILSIIKE